MTGQKDFGLQQGRNTIKRSEWKKWWSRAQPLGNSVKQKQETRAGKGKLMKSNTKEDNEGKIIKTFFSCFFSSFIPFFFLYRTLVRLKSPCTLWVKSESFCIFFKDWLILVKERKTSLEVAFSECFKRP